MVNFKVLSWSDMIFVQSENSFMNGSLSSSSASWFESMIHFFRSSAWSVDSLRLAFGHHRWPPGSTTLRTRTGGPCRRRYETGQGRAAHAGGEEAAPRNPRIRPKASTSSSICSVQSVFWPVLDSSGSVCLCS